MRGIFSDMAAEQRHTRLPFQQQGSRPFRVRRRDTRLLYYDTDSLGYSYDVSYDDPLPVGSRLGDLVEEWPGWRIIAFYTSKPKICSDSIPLPLKIQRVRNRILWSWRMK